MATIKNLTVITERIRMDNRVPIGGKIKIIEQVIKQYKSLMELGDLQGNDLVQHTANLQHFQGELKHYADLQAEIDKTTT